MPLGHLIDMIDFYGRPFQVDASLRVVTGHGAGYLDGNVHTHRGRFGVWYPEEGDGFPTSLSDIESMTDEAACWIAGFLAGNEPGPEEYLGIEHIDAALEVEPTATELDRWRNFTAEFRRTGYCPMLKARPIEPVPITDARRRRIRVDPWVPWSYAGQRVWIQRDEPWVEADPQPPTDEWGFLPDSICAQRAFHEDVEDDDDDVDNLSAEWGVCQDCGFVDFSPGAVYVELSSTD